jgi:hypothetical protein
MSFWQGVVKGVEAGEAKREKEAVREDRLASEAKAESRWQMQWENTLANQQEAREQAEAALILEQKRFDIGQLRQTEQDEIAAAGRVEEQNRYETSEKRLDEQGRITAENTAYERSYRIIRDARADEYKDKAWALDVDQWDFTKNNAAQAQANADRIFNQQLVRFEREGAQIDEATSRADRAEARAVADDLFQKERLVLTDAVAEQNRKDRMAQFDKTFGLQVQQFELDKEYKDRAWALGLEKWDFTKDQADLAQENSDRIFTQGIAAFERQGDQMTLVNERDDRAEARAIADALFAKERLVLTDSIAEQNRKDRMAQFDKTFGLQERSQDFNEAQVFVKLMPAGLISAFGGDAVSPTGDKPKTVSAKAMQSGNAVFSKKLDQLEEGERNSPFFKAAAGSAGAQATIMAFMEAQAKKGNTVQLKDMPKYFEYLGSTAEQGADEAKEFLNNAIGGEGWGDKDSLIKGLIALKNYKPAQSLFVQTGAPAGLPDTAAQVSLWETAVEVDARRVVKSLPAAKQDSAKFGLSLLQRSETRVQGLDILASLGFGLTAAKEKNMMDNPIIKGYYNAAENTSPAAVAEANQTTAGSTQEPRVFSSFAEADEARRNEGFSGEAVIQGDGEGKVYPIRAFEQTPLEDPYEGQTGGFKVEEGTKPLPENTSIDAMFGTTFDTPVFNAKPSVEVDPTIADVPKVVLNEGVSDIKKIVTSGATDEELVTSITAEMMDMGVEWPTNLEELNFFKEDLKSLAYDYDANIPATVMQSIVDSAIARAVPESPEGQVSGPSSEEKIQAQLSLKGNAEPDTWYSLIVPGRNLNRPFKVKGSDLSFLPDLAIGRNAILSQVNDGEDLPSKTLSGDRIKRLYK